MLFSRLARRVKARSRPILADMYDIAPARDPFKALGRREVAQLDARHLVEAEEGSAARTRPWPAIMSGLSALISLPGS